MLIVQIHPIWKVRCGAIRGMTSASSSSSIFPYNMMLTKLVLEDLSKQPVSSCCNMLIVQIHPIWKVCSGAIRGMTSASSFSSIFAATKKIVGNIPEGAMPFIMNYHAVGFYCLYVILLKSPEQSQWGSMEWWYCFQDMGGIMQCSSSRDARKELDCHHPSPVSILETSFSNESCNSSDSLAANNGEKLNSSSSIQAQNRNGDSCPKMTPSLDAAEELSDSATSRFMSEKDNEPRPSISAPGHMGTVKQEMDYVKEILFDARLSFQELALGDVHDIIYPCLFDRLETQKLGLRSKEDDESSKLSRRELFDCVSECVDSKCSRYLCAGYKEWAKGAAIVRKEVMAEEIYKDIMGWRSMGEWMVDELVDKDMSSHLGRWLDFDAEAFETGMEIERRILRSLLDEVFIDLL